MNKVELLFWLIGCHYIADFALQSDWIAKMKGVRWYVLLAHVAIWTTIICIPIRLFADLTPLTVGVLFVGHWLMDRWKASQPMDDEHWYLIYYDQAFHIAQIVIAVVLS